MTPDSNSYIPYTYDADVEQWYSAYTYGVPVTLDPFGSTSKFNDRRGSVKGTITVGGGGDPEAGLIGGKLIRGGLLAGRRLVG